MKKLWPRQVGEEKQVAVRKVCRDQESMSLPGIMSRPEEYVATRKVCRDQESMSRLGKYVATRRVCRDQNYYRNLKKAEN